MKFLGLNKIFKPRPNRLIPLGDITNSYTGLHRKIRKLLVKPKLCEKCKKSLPVDLHNISGKYLKNLSDWIWLCRKCHCHIHHPKGYLTNTKLKTKINYINSHKD